MASAGPTNYIEKAHQLYRDGRYNEAMLYYTKALSMAKTKSQKIALHSNRAACYLKLHQFKQAAEECTAVLELDHKHTGALMLRAQTLVTLKEYHSALFDVNRLMELDPSSEVYQNLEARLRTQLSLAPILESEAELEEEEEEDDDDDGAETNRNCSIVTVEKNGQSAKPEPKRTSAAEVLAHEAQKTCENSKGWKAIPKPNGHSALDYARWDRVEDDSSDEDDGEDDCQPQYRFRVRTVGVRPVK